MKVLGLIGHPLTHSFSADYFKRKFSELNLKNYQYNLYDLPDISGIRDWANNIPDLIGLNVTIPYKEKIMNFLDEAEANAKEIGAVNTIKIEAGKWTGFNTDYYGCRDSLISLLDKNNKIKALILGTGGSSRAVRKVLHDEGIEYKVVSRTQSDEYLSYHQANSTGVISECMLIINTTPAGMHPNVDSMPEIDYNQITGDHALFDLIYNPAKTRFLSEGEKRGAAIKNGLEMLYIQAERSWEIWTIKNQ